MQSRIPLAIVDRGRLLLAHRNRGRTKLPEVHLSKERSGLALCQAIRDQLGFEVFLLRVPALGAEPVPVMRLQRDPPTLPSGFAWVSPHEVDCGAVPEPDRVALLDPDDIAFGQYAWFSLAEDWLRDAIGQMGHTVRFLEQWNSSTGNVLLRVSTEGPRFWFKAVNETNWREFLVVQALRDQFPEGRPRILALHTPWKAILYEHVQGISFAQTMRIAEWRVITKKLAAVQKSCEDRTGAFLRAGAIDLRAGVLLERLPALVSLLEGAISRAAVDAPEILGPDPFYGILPPHTTPEQHRRHLFPPNPREFQELRPLLPALCSEVAALPFPDVLFNAAIAPRDVILTPGGKLVLLDWAQACVGWPLFAGECFWLRSGSVSEKHARWNTLLRSIWLDGWEKIVGWNAESRGLQLLNAFFWLATAILDCERLGYQEIDDDDLLRYAHMLHIMTHSAFEHYRVGQTGTPL